MSVCRYIGICNLYNKDSKACNNNDAVKNYYGVGRSAGCYRRMRDRLNESKGTSRKIKG